MPELTIEVFERLLRNPERFKLRRYNIVGVRRDVFRAFGALLSSPGQVSVKQNIIVVVRPLFKFLSRLPEYTRQTRSLSSNAYRVREALFSSREPDLLLFDELPKACGFEPFGPKASGNPDDFFGALRVALTELQRVYDELLGGLEGLLFSGFGVSDRNEPRSLLRFRAERIQEHAIDPRLKAFTMLLGDEQPEDIAWIEAIASMVVGKPARSWNDGDRAKFEIGLTDLIRNFRHMEALVFELNSKRESGITPAEVIRISVTDSHSKDAEAVVSVTSEDREQLARSVFELEECLERLHIVNNPEMSLAALAVVSRKLLDELLGKSTNTLSSTTKKKNEVAK